MDHMVDVLGVLVLLSGLALSGRMSVAVAVGLAMAYSLLSIHIYLATYTLGVFQIAYGKVGGTELRLLLVGANLALFSWPSLRLAGHEILLFDLCGSLAITGLMAVLLAEVLKSVRQLCEMERI